MQVCEEKFFGKWVLTVPFASFFVLKNFFSTQKMFLFIAGLKICITFAAPFVVRKDNRVTLTNKLK